MISTFVLLSWGQLILMILGWLAAFLELRSREAKLWTIDILSSLAMSFATYNWAVHNTVDSLSWHIKGGILLTIVCAFGALFGRMAYNKEKPIINVHDKTISIVGSVVPLYGVSTAYIMTIVWEYITVLYPLMSFCRIILDLHLFFVAGLLIGRSSFYRMSYAKRVKAVQVFGD